jgi:RNA polymerase sigma-70 factor (ECF subfamily)
VKGGGIRVLDSDFARQRDVVDAFFLATREDDFDALVSLLDPDVVLRSGAGAWRPAASMVIHGAAAVARQILTGLASSIARPAIHLCPRW